MWISGLEALRKPLLHLHTQAHLSLPWTTHRHGLHEPQPGRARRPGIRLHPVAPRGVPDDRGRARVASRGRAERIGSWARAAAAIADMRDAAAGPVRRQHAGRRGHRGRQGRGRTRISVRRSTPTASTIWWPSSTPCRRRRHRHARRGVLGNLRDRRRTAAGRRAARLAALRRPDRGAACGSFSPTAGSGRSPPTSRTSAGCGNCPGLAVQRLMADGYGFGGEGDWKTSMLLRDVQGDAATACPAARRSWRTTPTTWARAAAHPRRAHARGVPVDRRATARGWRSTRSASATGRIRYA